MGVNYLVEINALDDWELTHPLNPTAYKVMRKLLYLANKERFPERMNVPNTVLMSIVGCSEDSLAKARNQLIQAGLIVYKGQKKITPLYTIRYFSHNPTRNPKMAGYEQGYEQGIEQGNKRGYEQGIEQGTYINKTKGNEPKENKLESDEDGTAAAGVRARGGDCDEMPVRHRARRLNVSEDRIDAVFPLRARPLTPMEQQQLSAIQVYLAQPDVNALVRARMPVVNRILNSGRFPLELMGEALVSTVKRDKNYALDNPVAYMLTLLFDWEERGIATAQELRESKDDWWERG